MPEDDDEVNVDFEKLKKWFGKKPDSHSEHQEHSEQPKPAPAEEKSHHDHSQHNISKRDRMEQEQKKSEEPEVTQVIQEAEKIEDEKEKDDSEIDISKIGASLKGLLKSRKREKDVEDVSVNLGPVISTAKKLRKYWVPLLAVIVIIWISSSVRLQSNDLHVADD